jgi:hypothetical protein
LASADRNRLEGESVESKPTDHIPLFPLLTPVQEFCAKANIVGISALDFTQFQWMLMLRMSSLARPGTKRARRYIQRQREALKMMRTISDIDIKNGIIRLSDGTRWQVDVMDLAAIASWRLMSSIEVLERKYATQLRDIESGDTVKASLCK